MQEAKTFDCIVIGAGPGGLTAAIYLRRFLRTVLIVHTSQSRARWISRCGNLIGFDEGVSGDELLSRLWKQAKDLEVESIIAEASVRHQDSLFRVDAGAEQFIAHKVIIATGVSDLQPNWENLVELRMLQVMRYCPICDGYEHRNEPIAVLAKDEHGIREALFVRSFSDRITLFLDENYQLSRELNERIDTSQIRLIRSPITSVEATGDKGRKWVHLRFGPTSENLSVRVIYVALGMKANDRAFKHLNLRRTEQGFLVVDAHQRTSEAGIFAVGDCVEGLSQIVVAASQGALAAVTIHNDLRTHA